jgi:mannose PTS system EIIA component
MKRILIATHGSMANGIKNSIHILTGMDDQITTINAYLENDNSDYTVKIREFIDAIKPEDEAFIFTDINGGSVNQKVCLLMSETNKDIFVITGTNLMIVLAVLLEPRKITKEVLQELIDQASVQIVETKVDNDTSDISDEENFLN